MVCAEARKCHAGWLKKLRCSTTMISIFAAFRAYFDSRTRYSRFSPDLNGTGISTGGAGVAATLPCFLDGLDCCANPMEASASAPASRSTETVTDGKRV